MFLGQLNFNLTKEIKITESVLIKAKTADIYNLLQSFATKIWNDENDLNNVDFLFYSQLKNDGIRHLENGVQCFPSSKI